MPGLDVLERGVWCGRLDSPDTYARDHQAQARQNCECYRAHSALLFRIPSYLIA